MWTSATVARPPQGSMFRACQEGFHITTYVKSDYELLQNSCQLPDQQHAGVPNKVDREYIHF